MRRQMKKVPLNALFVCPVSLLCMKPSLWLCNRSQRWSGRCHPVPCCSSSIQTCTASPGFKTVSSLRNILCFYQGRAHLTLGLCPSYCAPGCFQPPHPLPEVAMQSGHWKQAKSEFRGAQWQSFHVVWFSHTTLEVVLTYTGHLVLVPISGTAADSSSWPYWSCVCRPPLFSAISDILCTDPHMALFNSVHHVASSAWGKAFVCMEDKWQATSCKCCSLSFGSSADPPPKKDEMLSSLVFPTLSPSPLEMESRACIYWLGFYQ